MRTVRRASLPVSEMDEHVLESFRSIVLRIAHHLSIWSRRAGVRRRCAMYHRSELRQTRDINLLSRAFSWLLFSCPIRDLPRYHRRFFPSNRIAILAAGEIVRRRDMEHLPALNHLMEEYREMQALTSLLEISDTSTSDIMGSDSDATDCDLAEAISLPSTPESSDREDSRPLNFTIDISEEEPIQRHESTDDVCLSSSPISAPDPDENDVGILRSRPCGRLATVLIRDFCEPVAAAWNAIRQREASWPEPLSAGNEGARGREWSDH
ncbi:hypothetical protein QAD02_007715 [Eretmocerus hayati]|uniref:Uncharacterized protein n=1 Tax=Eretmocerus hayati TaxID=131215 RepID=A0ACC2N4H3_9HYME|nr:hypothetical protein QAD02_007715 [Eretmocerus hayati]